MLNHKVTQEEKLINLKTVLKYAVSTTTLISSLPALSQDEMSTDIMVDEIVVTAGRMPTKITSIPHSVTIISSEEVEKQAKITTDLGAMLAAQIPGLAVSSQSNSNFTQTMRGRKPAILIDGILIDSPLRDGGRSLRTISPSAVGSVEVIRGSTSIYGNGGAGGVINFVTKQPTDGDTEISMEAGLGGSLTNLGDGLRYITEASISSKHGAFDYILTGYYENVGVFYDADGDMISPDPQLQGGIAASENYNIYAKLGFDVADGQRLEVSGMIYKSSQNIKYGQDVLNPGNRVADLKQGASETPSFVQELDSPLDRRRVGLFTDNKMFIGKYINDDVLGSKLSLAAYYQEVEAAFSWYQFFPAIDSTSPDPELSTQGGQSAIASEKNGARLDFVTPLDIFQSGQLLWGIDFGKDKTSQPLLDGRSYLAPLDQSSLAGFFQLEVGLADWLTFRGGLRYEDMSVETDDFIALFTSTPITGGKIDYSELLMNFGAVANVTDNLDVYAGFSQGFSLADIGRITRTADLSGFTSFEGLDPAPQVIDNYEVGIRGHFEKVQMSLAGFVSTSELGSSINAQTLEVDRAPERIWGLEATFDVDVTESARLGGSYTWVDGKQDTNLDGDYDTSLNSSRIAPAKLTAYLEYDFYSDWSTRLQMLHSFSQEKFSHKNPLLLGFAEAPIESYTTFDLVIGGPVGPGNLSLAFQNLLNADYYTPDSYIFTDLNPATPDFSFAKAPGATFTIKYAIDF